MSDVQAGLGSRLENVFLAILRVVILVVLALSLVGAVGWALYGVKEMSASESSYKVEKVDTKALMQELRKSLETQTAADPAAAPASKPAAAKEEKKDLEDELNKQVKTVADFLAQFDRNLTNPEAFKSGLRRKAMQLASEPESDASVLEYAKGQSEFFALAFTDAKIIETLKKRGQESLESFFSAAVSAYSDFFEKQRAERNKFERQESQRVDMAKAGAVMKLYVAAGLFGAFLLISLILVLVKIERNLRTRPL